MTTIASPSTRPAISNHPPQPREAVTTTHGLSEHPLYSTWANMMARCYNPRVRSYRDYGARGITVSARWHDVRLFITDIENSIGPRPSGLTLDRTDNDSDYAPGKVRWITRAEQNRNSRRYRDGTRTGALYQCWWRLMTQRPDEVRERWHGWPAFRDDIKRLIGPRPDGMRFERIDARQPYGPGNVAWVTGTAQVERARAARLANPYKVKHGLWQHPLYATWQKLARTCREKLHEPWLDVSTFVRDVEAELGPRPAGKAFRLVDPDGKYAPGNICWGSRGRPSRK